MKAVDTNVLVRYLVEDDARQSAAALFKQATANDEMLFVSDIVVCEVVWVLSVSYGFSRMAIAPVLRDLFRARQLAFTAPERLIRALGAFESGKGDYADYLIREHARGAGCEEVLTFDKALLREAGFVAAR